MNSYTACNAIQTQPLYANTRTSKQEFSSHPGSIESSHITFEIGNAFFCVRSCISQFPVVPDTGYRPCTCMYCMHCDACSCQMCKSARSRLERRQTAGASSSRVELMRACTRSISACWPCSSTCKIHKKGFFLGKRPRHQKSAEGCYATMQKDLWRERSLDLAPNLSVCSRMLHHVVRITASSATQQTPSSQHTYVVYSSPCGPNTTQ
jgi:hypothetical protein